MNVTAKRLTKTDELFMNAYQAIYLLRANLESLPQNKEPESRILLNAACDSLIKNLTGLKELDR